MEPTQPEGENPTFPMVPAQPADEASAPGSATSNKRNLTAGIGGLIVLCLVCALCGGVVKAIGGGGSSTDTGGATTDSAARIATQSAVVLAAQPTATATTDPNNHAAVVAYGAVVIADSQTVADDLNAVGQDCTSDLSTIDLCQSDVQQVKTDAQSFQQDIHQTPAPPCLAAADRAIRQALSNLITGSQDASDGIDAYNAGDNNTATADMQTGAALYGKATTEMHTATSLVNSATCP